MVNKMCSNSTNQGDVNLIKNDYNNSTIVESNPVKNFESATTFAMNSPIDFKVCFDINVLCIVRSLYIDFDEEIIFKYFITYLISQALLLELVYKSIPIIALRQC